MISFAVQKLLSLIRFHLFIFAFVSFALGYRSKKNIMSKSVLPMFSSRKFIVSGLTALQEIGEGFRRINILNRF